MRQTLSHTPEAICGRVEQLYYCSPRFSAGRLRTASGRSIPFAGSLMVRQHDVVVLHGKWETHPKYGRQFSVIHFAFDQQLSASGLSHYLSHHPDIKGIGPVRAKRIAEAFGAGFAMALKDDPQRIAKVARVPLSAVMRLQGIWARTETVNATLTWLASFGLTHHQVTTLIDKLGNAAVTALKTDPFRLVGEVPGFGFRRVDVVARKMGMEKGHPSRLKAGIVHCIAERLEQGDCWVDYEALVRQANHLLIMDAIDSRERIEQALDGIIDDKTLHCASVGGRFLVSDPGIYRQEMDLAKVSKSGRAENPHLSNIDNLDALIRELAPDLIEGQLAAIHAAARYRQVLVCGGAGTGKTYLIAAICRLYEHLGKSVVLAAPTGKAAKRIEQVVGRPALTLHRLLGFDGEQFSRGADSPIQADVVLIDEVSMVDIPLAWQLFSALDRSRTCVVLVGDHNQLPPVGPGNLLRDLIERRPIPTVVLEQVVRQAGVLKQRCTAVLRGEVRGTTDTEGDNGRKPWVVLSRYRDIMDVQQDVLQLFSSVLSEQMGFDLLGDVQLLSPTKKGPLGTGALNVKLQRLLQRKLWGVEVPGTQPGRRPPLLVHDRVIQTRNNYDLGVFNGAIGVVIEVGDQPGELRVRFDDREVEITEAKGGARDLSLAYCLTIHRAQGSEFPCTVVIIHKSHAFMHHRNLLYTAVTRARQVAIVVGDRWGLSNCAKTAQVEQRKTFLSVVDLPCVSRTVGAA